MKYTQITEGLGIVGGIDWLRWYFGVSYEEQPNVRAIVLRFGPLYVHFIS